MVFEKCCIATRTKKDQYTFVYWSFLSSQRDLKEHGHAVGGVNNSPVGCYLVRGSQPVGMSTGVTTATLLCVCFFVWVGAAGFEAGRLEWPPRALWPYSAEKYLL